MEWLPRLLVNAVAPCITETELQDIMERPG